jgi:hypothetical protein
MRFHSDIRYRRGLFSTQIRSNDSMPPGIEWTWLSASVSGLYIHLLLVEALFGHHFRQQ